ncbi:glycosyl hydrolase family 61-domain-containing protein [Xylariaceae sp. FL0804]|nr:glycosyl hydrolase family 61-domain-containing protein [Xylariaceae sp. FL0804]
MFKSVLAASALLATASAHQNFHQFWVNGVSPGYEVDVRMPPSNSPVTDVTSDDMACNVDGDTVPSGVGTFAATEGDSITVGWDISSHPGPITHFLFGPVDDASQESGVGAGWFKIDELDYTNGSWANEVLENNGGNYTFNLPTGLQSGEYLLRSEMLALHAATTVGGAQFYIGCAQLKITGTGTGCSPTISIPGAYKAKDDNILITDLYNGFDPTTYTAPGGAVATCGAGSGSGSGSAATTLASAVSTSSATATAVSVVKASASVSASSTSSVKSSATSRASSSASTTAPTTSAAKTTVSTSSVRTTLSTTTVSTSTPSTTSSASSSTGGVVAKYHQCGGKNYTGSTECVSGSTCKVMNDYYSQCVAE